MDNFKGGQNQYGHITDPALTALQGSTAVHT